MRFHGLRGVQELLRANFYASTSCLRLRRDLERYSPDTTAERGLLRVERGDIATLAAWRMSQAKSLLPMDFFADRTHCLRHFYLGYWDGSLAHILWLAEEGDPSTISDWLIGRQEVELRNGHTLRDFRGKGIFQSVAQTALTEIRERGIRTAYGHVDAGNAASLGVLLRLGFRPTHRVSILRVLGKDRIRQSPIEA